MGTVLARFVQISDLHFKIAHGDDKGLKVGGRLLPNPRNGFHVAHSYAQCRALAAFINRLAAEAQYGPPTVLITGDLTNSGSCEEMDFVRRYLDGGALFGMHIPLGLVPTDWRRYMILGNHDHWGGEAWPLFPSANTPKCGLLWPQTGVTLPLHCNDGKRKVIRFIGIDTDADAGRAHRAFAVGAFCSQIEKLRRHPALPQSRPADEIRVVCMHHALYYTRTPYLSIQSDSRKMLRRFLADYEVSVLLTGHIHETVFAHIATPKHGCGWRTLESSCGTTTRDVRWYRRTLSTLGIAYLNQLVVHTIEAVEGRLTWRADDYHFREGKGFVPSMVSGNDRRATSTIDLP